MTGGVAHAGRAMAMPGVEALRAAAFLAADAAAKSDSEGPSNKALLLGLGLGLGFTLVLLIVSAALWLFCRARRAESATSPGCFSTCIDRTASKSANPLATADAGGALSQYSFLGSLELPTGTGAARGPTDVDRAVVTLTESQRANVLRCIDAHTPDGPLTQFPGARLKAPHLLVYEKLNPFVLSWFLLDCVEQGTPAHAEEPFESLGRTHDESFVLLRTCLKTGGPLTVHDCISLSLPNAGDVLYYQYIWNSSCRRVFRPSGSKGWEGWDRKLLESPSYGYAMSFVECAADLENPESFNRFSVTEKHYSGAEWGEMVRKRTAFSPSQFLLFSLPSARGNATVCHLALPYTEGIFHHGFRFRLEQPDAHQTEAFIKSLLYVYAFSTSICASINQQIDLPWFDRGALPPGADRLEVFKYCWEGMQSTFTELNWPITSFELSVPTSKVRYSTRAGFEQVPRSEMNPLEQRYFFLVESK